MKKFENFAKYLPSQLKCRLSSVFVIIVYIRGGITICCEIFIFFVWVQEHGFLKFAKLMQSNIDKFIQWQYVDMLSREIRNDAKSGNWVIEHRTI